MHTYNKCIRCTDCVETMVKRLELWVDGFVEQKITIQMYVLCNKQKYHNNVTVHLAVHGLTL